MFDTKKRDCTLRYAKRNTNNNGHYDRSAFSSHFFLSENEHLWLLLSVARFISSICRIIRITLIFTNCMCFDVTIRGRILFFNLQIRRPRHECILRLYICIYLYLYIYIIYILLVAVIIRGEGATHNKC